ncbi:hypothetical protein HELRODRAFT_163334 [Helobdella robusta]|uniref:Uncharacterized protein n=1 Tax=Helobdella robusta TaxID=6412 RepID=T1ETX3_HELRO|nr:hypothetical protein HELRODRAFT_163334 [Helobdella robusta]ESN96285.1 hypothetical protein HELRODRAFT_163334 [Helobdella robusta]
MTKYRNDVTKRLISAKKRELSELKCRLHESRDKLVELRNEKKLLLLHQQILNKCLRCFTNEDEAYSCYCKVNVEIMKLDKKNVCNLKQNVCQQKLILSKTNERVHSLSCHLSRLNLLLSASNKLESADVLKEKINAVESELLGRDDKIEKYKHLIEETNQRNKNEMADQNHSLANAINNLQIEKDKMFHVENKLKFVTKKLELAKLNLLNKKNNDSMGRLKSRHAEQRRLEDDCSSRPSTDYKLAHEKQNVDETKSVIKVDENKKVCMCVNMRLQKKKKIENSGQEGKTTKLLGPLARRPPHNFATSTPLGNDFKIFEEKPAVNGPDLVDGVSDCDETANTTETIFDKVGPGGQSTSALDNPTVSEISKINIKYESIVTESIDEENEVKDGKEKRNSEHLTGTPNTNNHDGSLDNNNDHFRLNAIQNLNKNLEKNVSSHSYKEVKKCHKAKSTSTELSDSQKASMSHESPVRKVYVFRNTVENMHKGVPAHSKSV